MMRLPPDRSRRRVPSRTYAIVLLAELLIQGPRTRPAAHWWERARCAGDSDFQYDTNTPRQRRVCAECPVARDCLLDAIATEAVPGTAGAGVRAGLTERERARLARSSSSRLIVHQVPRDHTTSARAAFISIVEDLVESGVGVRDAMASTGYSDANKSFQRRLWRAGRSDLLRALQDNDKKRTTAA